MNHSLRFASDAPAGHFRGPAFVAIIFGFALALASVEAVSARQGPPTFGHAELVRLYEEETLSEPLAAKLRTLLTTPFVNNSATAARGVRPLKPASPRLGRFLRVAQWNIERGIEFEAVAAALADGERLAALLDRRKFPRGEGRAEVLRQAALLKEADVIVLNEVDWGLKRSGYRNVAAELAAALGMNYAYGVEFVEVDPVQLGTEQFAGAKEADRRALLSHIRVEPARLRALHGTAILSRYPLENVRLVPFAFQGHDWYADERKGVAPFERGKRTVSERVFLEKVTREVRRGGRTTLLAEISDPDIPGGRATVVATHLEARTEPKNRARQLNELLALVGDIPHPVILAGDMNTSTQDMTPTSLRREIRKRLGDERFWLEQGVKYATGVGLLLDVVKGGLDFSRTHADPTVRSVKFVAENPEAEFFDDLKDFRFADGGAFDFRGDAARTSNGRAGLLANSNERARKGFATTYAVSRTLGPTGKYKLDWIFVKPPAPPAGGGRPYRFAPHFGRTLEELNYSTPDRISDHNPVVVDLPFAEPPEKAKVKR
jgi:endonuclease/exonuclease/phosphatase family metal-dependent hydrolase